MFVIQDLAVSYKLSTISGTISSASTVYVGPVNITVTVFFSAAVNVPVASAEVSVYEYPIAAEPVYVGSFVGNTTTFVLYNVRLTGGTKYIVGARVRSLGGDWSSEYFTPKQIVDFSPPLVVSAPQFSIRTAYPGYTYGVLPGSDPTPVVLTFNALTAAMDTTSLDRLLFTWNDAIFEPESGIDRYELCASFANAPTACEVSPWTSTGTNTSVTMALGGSSSRSIVDGDVIVMFLRAVNSVGLMSAAVQGPQLRFVTSAPAVVGPASVECDACTIASSLHGNVSAAVNQTGAWGSLTEYILPADVDAAATFTVTFANAFW